MTPRTMNRIRILILIGLLIWIAVRIIQHLSTPSTTLSQQAPTLSVIPGAHPLLEVYVDDVLTSEWQPSDGEVYWVLWEMVER